MMPILIMLQALKTVLTPAFTIEKTKMKSIVRITPRTTNGSDCTITVVYFEPQATLQVSVNGQLTKGQDRVLFTTKQSNLNTEQLETAIKNAILPLLVRSGIQLDGYRQDDYYNVLNQVVAELEKHNTPFKLEGVSNGDIRLDSPNFNKYLLMTVQQGLYVRGSQLTPLTTQHIHMVCS